LAPPRKIPKSNPKIATPKCAFQSLKRLGLTFLSQVAQKSGIMGLLTLSSFPNENLFSGKSLKPILETLFLEVIINGIRCLKRA